MATMAGALFLMKIRTAEKCISLPRARAIISTKGLFAWDVWLPAGTPVVVQRCDGQHELPLFGTVSTSNADLGVAIEFKETTEGMSRRLVALLVA
jgi:hypothetical protein